MKSKRRNVQLVFDISITESFEKNSDNRFTTYALLMSVDPWEKTNRKYVFFDSINHPPWRCLKVSNPQHKRTILERNVLCFIYFQWVLRICWVIILAINVKENTTSVLVLNLKKTNDRNNTGSSDQSNTTNVNKNTTNPTDETTNNFTSNTTKNVNNVLIQTAKETASNLNDSSFANTSGSVRTS